MTPQRLQAVLPADLLAFLVRPAVIADGHFVDAEFPLGALHDDLRLEAEAVGADGDALQQIGAEDLVAGLHVRQVQIAEHVGDQRQALVDHGVPEGQHARLLAGHVARAEDRVGVAVEQRPEQARIFRGIVFEVGVLDEGEIAGGLVDGGAHGRALAAVLLVAVEVDLRETRRPAARGCRRCRRWSSRRR